MKSRAAFASAQSARFARGATPAPIATGSHCPMTGFWIPVDNHNSAHFVSEGSLMPAFGGQPVAWTLRTELVPQHLPAIS